VEDETLASRATSFKVALIFETVATVP